MSNQPTGYNLPTNLNVDSYVALPYQTQTSSTATVSTRSYASCLEAIPLDNRSLRADCYDALTGRVHELMHHRDHQEEY